MTTSDTTNMSFSTFVELMQEASGDRARKIARIKAEIKQMETHISNMEQSHDRYHTAGSAKEDHAKLSSLRAQLRRYEPTKGPSSKQKRNNAIKKVEAHKKWKADHEAKQAKEKADKEKSDQIHNAAKKAADEHVDKHHKIPARNHGEDIFDYISRTKEHQSAKSDAHYKKYWEVKKKLQDGHKNV